MSSNPYASALRRTETPRQCEARALSEINSEMRVVGAQVQSFLAQRGLGQLSLSAVPAEDVGEVVQLRALLQAAVERNNQFWSLISQACSSDQNELPVEVRKNIIGLASNILSISARVLTGQEKVDTLIELNNHIIAGLNMRPA